MSDKIKVRDRRVVFMINKEEEELINVYLKKYKISNRSRWYRQTIMTHVLKVLTQDYPTLFDENEMRR
ncbi:MAG: hypothetical protein ACOYEA_02505 [Fermentimonas sp.]|jgi:hypothetical protein